MGSEMCIRDRRRADSWVKRSWDQRELRRSSTCSVFSKYETCRLLQCGVSYSSALVAKKYMSVILSHGATVYCGAARVVSSCILLAICLAQRVEHSREGHFFLSTCLVLESSYSAAFRDHLCPTSDSSFPSIYAPRLGSTWQKLAFPVSHTKAATQNLSYLTHRLS